MKKESDKKMEYDLEEKFSPIVERIHEMAKEFHTSKKFYFYDSGTGKVIECGEVIYCCMKKWRETKEYSTIFELGFSREEIVKELYELWKIVQEEHVLQAIPVEQFYIPEKLENYISENVEMLILELTERCNLRCKYCIYQEDNKSYRTYGERRIYTTTDGRFNVCERIGFSPDIGNVETGIDYSLVKKYYIDQYTENSIKDCKHCWAVNLCAVCYAYCYDEQGLNMDTKRAVCSRVRFLKEQALIHYHELLEQAPEYLEKLLAIPKE